MGLACLPLVVALASFAGGAFAFLRGDAVEMSYGLPGFKFYNLNRVTRVPRTTSGCMVSGLELFTHSPNNAAISLLTWAAGPMRGAYLGAYPSEDEASVLLEKGEVVSRAELVRQRLLPDAEGPSVDERMEMPLWATFRDEAEFRIIAVEGNGLLVGAERGMETDPRTVIALVDMNARRLVARWSVHPH